MSNSVDVDAVVLQYPTISVTFIHPFDLQKIINQCLYDSRLMCHPFLLKTAVGDMCRINGINYIATRNAEKLE